jgi:hypothetical protein
LGEMLKVFIVYSFTSAVLNLWIEYHAKHFQRFLI